MKKILMLVSASIFLLFGHTTQTLAAGNTYQVKKGDTLWSIAKKNDITIKQIKSWNNLNTDKIKIDQVLKITASAKKTAASVKTMTNPEPAVKSASYKEITVKATAYTASCKNCSGITYTGINLKKNPNAKVISVDPKVIPLGSKVYIPGYGEAIAADKGSSIKGNKIDIFIPNKKRALQWGNKTVKIKVYN